MTKASYFIVDTAMQAQSPIEAVYVSIHKPRANKCGGGVCTLCHGSTPSKHVVRLGKRYPPSDVSGT